MGMSPGLDEQGQGEGTTMHRGAVQGTDISSQLSSTLIEDLTKPSLGAA